LCYFVDGHYTIGKVDGSIWTTLLGRITSGGLYVESRGLYLLPTPVQKRGRITEVCALGYPRAEHQNLLVDEETGGLDLDSIIYGFVYFVLYRLDPSSTLYEMEYDPVLLYHQLPPGCVSQDDGLQMSVEEGDLLGAFIFEHCATADELISQANMATLNVMELRQLKLCPSQISLVDQCFHTLHLNAPQNTSVDDIRSIDLQQLLSVSARLNLGVVIEEGMSSGFLWGVGGGCGGWGGRGRGEGEGVKFVQ
jgi:hypothetical protein